MEMFPLPAAADAARRLASLAANVHRTYFWKYPPLRVQWGQRIARRRRRSIRLGSYNHRTSEIRIHPLLDSSQIPAYVIESVIHHEYLHHVLGARHNRRFHAGEKGFRYYRESQEWIRRNLFLLLGRTRRELEPRPVAPRIEPNPRLAQMALF
jgi:hypothetical protein